MTQLVDPWYCDSDHMPLTTNEELLFRCLDDIGLIYDDEPCTLLSDVACMRLCGALESELV